MRATYSTDVLRLLQVLLIVSADYFLSSQNPHHESLLTTVQKLKSDTDRDVRYFVSFQEETRLAEITDSVIKRADFLQYRCIYIMSSNIFYLLPTDTGVMFPAMRT